MLANKTLLQMKYARIVSLFAQKQGITLEDALDFFYSSDTYRQLKVGMGDLHCRSDGYIVDELLIEQKEATLTSPSYLA